MEPTTETYQLLRIVDRAVHAGASGSFLHLIEPHLLLIELLLDLRNPAHLARLRKVVRLVILYGAVGRTNRRIDLINPRLQSRHLFFLR